MFCVENACYLQHLHPIIMKLFSFINWHQSRLSYIYICIIPCGFCLRSCVSLQTNTTFDVTFLVNRVNRFFLAQVASGDRRSNEVKCTAPSSDFYITRTLQLTPSDGGEL